MRKAWARLVALLAGKRLLAFMARVPYVGQPVFIEKGNLVVYPRTTLRTRRRRVRPTQKVTTNGERAKR